MMESVTASNIAFQQSAYTVAVVDGFIIIIIIIFCFFFFIMVNQGRYIFLMLLLHSLWQHVILSSAHPLTTLFIRSATVASRKFY